MRVRSKKAPLRCRFDLGGLQLRGHGQRVALEYLQFRAADSRIIAGYCMYVYMFDLFIYLLVELFGVDSQSEKEGSPPEGRILDRRCLAEKG